MEYLKQIDTLRFYAVFGVMISHLYPDTFPVIQFVHEFYSYLPGVPLFFCISGFLITGILIRHADRPRHTLLKSFYARRFLRIFPIYYLTIFALYILNINNYRSWFIYDLFYMSNIIQGIRGDFQGSVAPHFWSLAVEEQFYVMWPLLLISIRNKTYQFIICLLIFIVGSGLMIFSKDHFFMSRTFGCLAYLGSGALLAICWKYYKDKLLASVNFLNIALVAFIIFVTIQSFNLFAISREFHVCISIILIPIVTLRFAIGFQSKAARLVVENPCILYIGKISYGIYIFHLLALFPAVAIKNFLHLTILENVGVMFVFKTLLTILISALSWEFFEKRINGLKRKFRYS